MNPSLNQGSFIARVLAGSWRQVPSPLKISAEQLEMVKPSLLATGAGALAWKRVSQSELRNSPAGLELEQAYRLHSLQSAIHERDIRDILKLLDHAGIESVL